MKKIHLEDWSNFDKLCLLHTIFKYKSSMGDLTWAFLSRETKKMNDEVGGMIQWEKRTDEWFSPRQCAGHYELVLKSLGPRKKKKTDRFDDDTLWALDGIYRKAFQQDLHQSCDEIEEEYWEVRKIREDFEAGKISKEIYDLHQKRWMEEEEEIRRNGIGLKKRKDKKDGLDIKSKLKSMLDEKNSENDSLKSLSSPSSSAPPERHPVTEGKTSSTTSPLLTSLLQSPSPLVRPSISSPSSSSPTISLLLHSSPPVPIADSTLSKLLENTPSASSANAPLPSSLSRASSEVVNKTNEKEINDGSVIVEDMTDIQHDDVESEIIIEHEASPSIKQAAVDTENILEVESEEVVESDETDDEVLETVEEIIEQVEEAIIETVGENHLDFIGDLNETEPIAIEDGVIEPIDQTVEVIVLSPRMGPDGSIIDNNESVVAISSPAVKINDGTVVIDDSSSETPGLEGSLKTSNPDRRVGIDDTPIEINSNTVVTGADTVNIDNETIVLGSSSEGNVSGSIIITNSPISDDCSIKFSGLSVVVDTVEKANSVCSTDAALVAIDEPAHKLVVETILLGTDNSTEVMSDSDTVTTSSEGLIEKLPIDPSIRLQEVHAEKLTIEKTCMELTITDKPLTSCPENKGTCEASSLCSSGTSKLEETSITDNTSTECNETIIMEDVIDSNQQPNEPVALDIITDKPSSPDTSTQIITTPDSSLPNENDEICSKDKNSECDSYVEAPSPVVSNISSSCVEEIPSSSTSSVSPSRQKSTVDNPTVVISSSDDNQDEGGDDAEAVSSQSISFTSLNCSSSSVIGDRSSSSVVLNQNSTDEHISESINVFTPKSADLSLISNYGQDNSPSPYKSETEVSIKDLKCKISVNNQSLSDLSKSSSSKVNDTSDPIKPWFDHPDSRNDNQNSSDYEEKDIDDTLEDVADMTINSDDLDTTLKCENCHSPSTVLPQVKTSSYCDSKGRRKEKKNELSENSDPSSSSDDAVIRKNSNDKPKLRSNSRRESVSLQKRIDLTLEKKQVPLPVETTSEEEISTRSSTPSSDADLEEDTGKISSETSSVKKKINENYPTVSQCFVSVSPVNFAEVESRTEKAFKSSKVKENSKQRQRTIDKSKDDDKDEFENERRTRASRSKRSLFNVSIDSKPASPAPSTSSTDDDRDLRAWKKSIMLVFNRLASHKFASVFSKPIRENEAPGYADVILRAMDLSTIKKNIENGVIRTTVEFQRDMLLMVQNAIMYNKYDTPYYKMALEMGKDMLAEMEIMVQAIGDGVPLLNFSYDEKSKPRARVSKSSTDDVNTKKRKQNPSEDSRSVKRSRTSSS